MNTGFEIIIENDAELDNDGWALIAPFGEHPKSRIARVNGIPTLQKFIQVLDNESADQVLAKENSLFGKLKRAIIGIPVYKGHPDLKTYAPETIRQVEKKQVIGVIDQVRKSSRGIEAHFAVTPEGAAAIENEGCKYPSPLWFVKQSGVFRQEAEIVRPLHLISVGLSDHPNISGVEALANARGAETTEETEPDMKLIIGYLTGQGVALANTESATESQVLEALQKFHTAKAGEVVALSNEKSTIAGKITKLETDVTAEKSKVTALENEKTTLGGKVVALENAFKSERKGRAEMAVDLAIQKGKLTIAERPAQITALENCADEAAFLTASTALLQKSKVVKLQGGDNAESGKTLGNDCDAPTARAQYATAFADHLKANPKDGPVKAHKAVLSKFPALVEKMKSEGADDAS